MNRKTVGLIMAIGGGAIVAAQWALLLTGNNLMPTSAVTPSGVLMGLGISRALGN